MRRVVHALLILLVTILTLPGEPVHAVTCVALEYQVPKLDTIVEGTIKAIPAPGKIRLSVTRYYKGTGGPSLDADVVALGAGQRMDWMEIPQRGDRVLIGFTRQDQTLRNDLCNPLVILKNGDQIPALLGAGIPPSGDAPPENRSPLTWILAGGLLFAGAVWAWVRTSRRA